MDGHRVDPGVFVLYPVGRVGVRRGALGAVLTGRHPLPRHGVRRQLRQVGGVRESRRSSTCANKKMRNLAKGTPLALWPSYLLYFSENEINRAGSK